jgi:phosphatidylglycerophosphate synthase
MGRLGVSVPARPLAKLKTLVQDLAVGAALLPVVGVHHRTLPVALLWLGVGLTVVSGGQYLLDGRRVRLGLAAGGRAASRAGVAPVDEVVRRAV